MDAGDVDTGHVDTGHVDTGDVDTGDVDTGIGTPAIETLAVRDHRTTETEMRADGTIGVVVVGPTGRMGERVRALVLAEPSMTLVACIGRSGEAGTVAADDVAADDVDVIIDFSHRDAIAAHAALCARHRWAWVVGTTGLGHEEQAVIASAAAETLVFQAANFSVGVALLADLAERAARVLGLDADVELVESHHHHKVDAPSGTALALAAAVARGRGQDLDSVLCHGRSGLVGARPRGEIGMHAMRLGDIVGHHEIHFAWPAEGMVLTHDARDRGVFAQGALRAALYAANRRRAGAIGLVGMRELVQDA